MSVRRATDPTITQRIWDAIKITVHQRNVPSNDRIVRHMARVYGMSEQSAQEELNRAKDDKLVFLKKVPAKSGPDQEHFRLPVEPEKDDDCHDWYCYKCQRAGTVHSCQQCFRVFHENCRAKKNLCEFCEKIKDDVCEDPASLNHILGFTCGHLKAKLPAEITNRTIVPDAKSIEIPAGGSSGPTWISEGEDAWRPAILIKNHMDLAIMEAKTARNGYKSLTEFQADAHNICHNIIIYHGEKSVVGEMGGTMYQDCCYDIREIRRCRDCYRISNEKSEKMWFCIPCDPPHKLVYAKQKGYPYWPAKLMQVNEDVYDVRFFGGQHMRANIDKIFIRPINASLASLQIKRSMAWNRAFEELKHHQNLLDKLSKVKSAGTKREATVEEGKKGGEDEEGRKAAKIRHLESGKVGKTIIKDLRIKVERLSSDELLEASPASKDEEKSDVKVEKTDEKREKSEERPVPRLPVAEDEPALEISSSCPRGLRKEGSQEDTVTSSCQEPRSKCVLVQTEQPDASVPPKTKREQRKTWDQPSTTTTTSDLEKLRRELELDKCRELERLQVEHAKEMRQLTDKHQQVISEIKKKQWCYNCEAEAIYHCCWNTAYCSTDCQQVHWQREHKRVCRRKR